MPCLAAEGHFASLIAARRSCRICLDRDPGKIRSGASFEFDPEVVSYWSQWLGHPQPQILIVGQDFGDWDYFIESDGADDPENDTNKNLYKLLVHIGLSPTIPPREDLKTRVFLTNSILCLKEPPMNRPVRNPWIRACTFHHLRPLIQKLRPPIVVGLGGPAWLAVRIAFEIESAPKKISEAAGHMWRTIAGIQVFAVGHCGGLGIRNRPWQKQLDDWTKIGAALKQLQ